MYIVNILEFFPSHNFDLSDTVCVWLDSVCVCVCVCRLDSNTVCVCVS